jgi:hypothetical protein
MSTDDADQLLLSNATMVEAVSVGNDELAVRSSTYKAKSGANL